MMPNHDDKLTRRQGQAILALLAHPTIGAAATACGVAEITLSRWLKLTDFQESYKRARRQAYESGLAVLQNSVGKAVQALLDVMDDPIAACPAKVSAARAIIENAARAKIDFDFDERLAVLENRFADQGIKK